MLFTVSAVLSAAFIILSCPLKPSRSIPVFIVESAALPVLFIEAVKPLAAAFLSFFHAASAAVGSALLFTLVFAVCALFSLWFRLLTLLPVLVPLVVFVFVFFVLFLLSVPVVFLLPPCFFSTWLLLLFLFSFWFRFSAFSLLFSFAFIVIFWALFFYAFRSFLYALLYCTAYSARAFLAR